MCVIPCIKAKADHVLLVHSANKVVEGLVCVMCSHTFNHFIQSRTCLIVIMFATEALAQYMQTRIQSFDLDHA